MSSNKNIAELRTRLDDIIEELLVLLALILLASFLGKIIFTNDSFGTIFKVVVSFAWMFVIPGYFLMLYWKGRIGFVERIFIGSACAAAVFGLSSFYLGRLELHIKYQVWLIPIVMMILGIVLLRYKGIAQIKSIKN